MTPCRIVDTRSGAGGTLVANDTRNWLAANPGGTFVAQGGSATNCGIPVKPAAVLVNLTVANTQSGPAFLVGYPFNQARPNAASLNWVAAGTQIANAIILPLCTGGGCTSDWSLFASSGTELIVDVMGYFAAPVATAVDCVSVASAATADRGELGHAGSRFPPAQRDTRAPDRSAPARRTFRAATSWKPVRPAACIAT